MSLGYLNLTIIREAMKHRAHRACASRRVLSLGYPDILASRAQIETALGAEVVAKLRWREDSASILEWHGAESVTDRVAEADSLFEALGLELEVIDIATVRGGEIVHDLNEPVPERYHERYAAVIDAGTLEHCFNIGTAVANVARMVALHGFALHGNPLNMFNHGFYNLSPVWYQDFYAANGFHLEFGGIVHGPLERQQLARAPLNRFEAAPPNAVNVMVARREVVRPIRWPIQGKYAAPPVAEGA